MSGDPTPTLCTRHAHALDAHASGDQPAAALRVICCMNSIYHFMYMHAVPKPFGTVLCARTPPPCQPHLQPTHIGLDSPAATHPPLPSTPPHPTPPCQDRVMSGDPWAADPCAMGLPHYRSRYYEMRFPELKGACVSSLA